MSESEPRLAQLRFIEGIEKVEHVPYSTGDQFWVRFNHPLDMQKLRDVVNKHGCQLIKFGGLPSKLPRRLGEVLWNGVTHVIAKNPNGFEKLTASLGFEPDGIGKIAVDLHGPYQIFIAMNEDGVRVLYDYLGVKYVPLVKPPAPPDTPVKTPTVIGPAVAAAPKQTTQSVSKQ